MPSTSIPDTHPLKPGFYSVDILGGHVIVGGDTGIYVNNSEPSPIEKKFWVLAFCGRGYTIQNWFTKKYASVAEEVTGSVVALSDKPFIWNIQPDGKGLYRILVPDKNLYWTEVVVWGVRLFKLGGSDGSSDQTFNFEPMWVDK